MAQQPLIKLLGKRPIQTNIQHRNYETATFHWNHHGFPGFFSSGNQANMLMSERKTPRKHTTFPDTTMQHGFYFWCQTSSLHFLCISMDKNPGSNHFWSCFAVVHSWGAVPPVVASLRMTFAIKKTRTKMFVQVDHDQDGRVPRCFLFTQSFHQRWMWSSSDGIFLGGWKSDPHLEKYRMLWNTSSWNVFFCFFSKMRYVFQRGGWGCVDFEGLSQQTHLDGGFFLVDMVAAWQRFVVIPFFSKVMNPPTRIEHFKLMKYGIIPSLKLT